MQKTFIALIVLALGFVLFFLRSGERALWSSDEGRYAEIPREMVESGDVISPHLNHVRYFEKPPLVYWLTAANFQLFGQSEAAARFWPAFLGALGLVMTWFFARRWFDADIGFWSAWFLLTSIGYFLVGRYLVLDMPFTFFFAAGMFCFIEGFENERKAFLVASYVLLGLATLVKGIVVGLFAVLIVSLHLTWTRQWSRWRDTGLLWGIGLSLAVVTPWFVAICRENPSFFEFFFVHEHLQRFVTHEAGRPGPVYYFFAIGMLFFFPWSLFVFGAGKGFASNRKKTFLLIWVLAVFGFFTVSRSKLPPYILPILPPLAMLTALRAKDLMARRALPGVFGIAFGAIGLAAIALSVVFMLSQKPEKQWIEYYAYAVAAIFLVGAGLAFLMARRQATVKYAFLAWGLAILMAYPVVILAMENLDKLQSSKDLATALRPVLRPGDILAIYGGYEDFSDLAFYLRRRIMIVGTNVGELSYGSRFPGQKEWFLSEDEFKELLGQAKAQGRNVYCVAQENEYNELVEKGIRNMDVLFVTPKAYVLRAGGEAISENNEIASSLRSSQ